MDENKAFRMAWLAAMMGTVRKDTKGSRLTYTHLLPHKRPIPKGLKPFEFGGEVVYAINRKNAERKAKKQGLI